MVVLCAQRLKRTIGMPKESCFVYAICCPDGGNYVYVKLGHSKDVAHRLRELKTGCPLHPMVVYSVDVGDRTRGFRFERALHKIFAHRRETGEWFKFGRWDLEEMSSQMRTALAKFDLGLSWSGQDARPMLKYSDASWSWAKRKRAA